METMGGNIALQGDEGVLIDQGENLSEGMSRKLGHVVISPFLRSGTNGVIVPFISSLAASILLIATPSPAPASLMIDRAHVSADSAYTRYPVKNRHVFLCSFRSLRSDTVKSTVYRKSFAFFLRSPPSEHKPNANLKATVLVQAFDFAKNERKDRK